MSSRKLCVSIPMACLLAVGLLGSAPVANAEAGGHSVHRTSKIAGKNRVKIRQPFRGVKIHLPVGPSYVYYDYPYYYSRGHYPTHIGGYIYYPSYAYRSHAKYVGPGSPRR
jgi:hypothetical protein